MPFSLHGIIPALVTPRRTGSDEPDTDGMGRFVAWQVESGVHGVLVCGSTGEAQLLSWKGRRAVIEAAAQAVSGRVPVIAGVGSASNAESLRLARDARDAGATHLAVLPQHYVPVTQEELYGYFAAVADSSDLPVVLYNYPARTSGQNIAPETAARLAAGHNVVGIKDSSENLSNALGYVDACGPDFAVLTGWESLLVPLLLSGGAGAISAGANLVPERVVSIYDAYCRGDIERAVGEQKKLLPWNRLIRIGTFPAPLKAALALIGRSVGEPFLPVAPIPERDLPALRALVGALTDAGGR